ncbi:MAG: hypothetical protein V1652_01625 [bacterium]
MADEKIVEYIQQGRSAGRDDARIRQELLNGDVKDKTIAAAFKFLSNPTAAEKAVQRKKGNILKTFFYTLGGGLFGLIVGLVLVATFAGNPVFFIVTDIIMFGLLSLSLSLLIIEGRVNKLFFIAIGCLFFAQVVAIALIYLPFDKGGRSLDFHEEGVVPIGMETVDGTDCELLCAKIVPSQDVPTISATERDGGMYYGNLDQKKEGTPDDWIHVLEGTRSASWRSPEVGKNYKCDCDTTPELKKDVIKQEDIINNKESTTQQTPFQRPLPNTSQSPVSDSVPDILPADDVLITFINSDDFIFVFENYGVKDQIIEGFLTAVKESEKETTRVAFKEMFSKSDEVRKVFKQAISMDEGMRSLVQQMYDINQSRAGQ